MNDEEYLGNCTLCTKRIFDTENLTERDKKDYLLLCYAQQCCKSHDGELIQDYRKAMGFLDKLNLPKDRHRNTQPIKDDSEGRVDLTEVFKRWLDK